MFDDVAAVVVAEHCVDCCACACGPTGWQPAVDVVHTEGHLYAPAVPAPAVVGLLGLVHHRSSAAAHQSIQVAYCCCCCTTDGHAGARRKARVGEAYVTGANILLEEAETKAASGTINTHTPNHAAQHPAQMQRTTTLAIAQPVQRKLSSVAFEAVEDTNYDSHFTFLQPRG